MCEKRVSSVLGIKTLHNCNDKIILIILKKVHATASNLEENSTEENSSVEPSTEVHSSGNRLGWARNKQPTTGKIFQKILFF